MSSMENLSELLDASKKSYQSCMAGNVKELCFVCITLLIYVLVGINRSYLAFLFHQLDLPDSKIVMDDEQKSWMASSLSLLSPLGCLASGVVMDLWGRKFFIQTVFIPFIISWLIIGVSNNYEMLLIGMLVQSIGGGMAVCIATYISEIATTSHRGALLSILEITYNAGILFCNLLMYNLPWDIVGLIFCGSSLFAFVLSFILPESPIWLYSRGKQEKSIKTLCSIRCQEREKIETEILEMEASCSTQTDTNLNGTFKNCLNAWKSFAICTALFALMQNTGYSIMIAFTITIVDRLKIPFESSKITLIYSITGFIGSFATPYFMHKLGRKTILSASAFGMAVSMTTIAIYEEMYLTHVEKPYAWIVPIALYAYVLLCNIGVLPISYAMCGELFPHEVRGTMNGLYGIVAYVYWSATLKFYPKFMFVFGIKVMIWAFAISCFMVTLYGIFILPETRGKSLVEVQQQYFRKKRLTDVKQT